MRYFPNFLWYLSYDLTFVSVTDKLFAFFVQEEDILLRNREGVITNVLNALDFLVVLSSLKKSSLLILFIFELLSLSLSKCK